MPGNQVRANYYFKPYGLRQGVKWVPKVIKRRHVRSRCLLCPVAAWAWSPCTVCSPAGQFHPISRSTDSPARSRHAVLTESAYKRHLCGLAVHAVRRVLGLLPGLCEKATANLITPRLFAQAGPESQHSLHSIYRKAAKVPFVRGFCRNGVSRARRRVRGARNGMKLSCRTAHSAGPIPKQPQDGGGTCVSQRSVRHEVPPLLLPRK